MNKDLPPVQASPPTASNALHLGEQTLNTAQRMAHNGIEAVSDSLGQAQNDTRNAARNLAHETEWMAQRSMDALRSGAHQLQHQATHLKNTAVHYVQQEPVKALLTAAAVGAALMAALRVISRWRKSD